MGGNNTKPTIIPYEDAVKRISDAELRRIREAFKRSAGTNGSLLNKNAFVQEVLCEGTPGNIADWLFQACGGTSKGIGFKELISALVLITRGTQDEKIRFLWALYSNDSNTLIVKNDFYKTLQIEATYQYQSTNSGTTTASAIKTNNNNNNQNINFNYLSLFGSSSSVSFEQFRSWILMHKGATVLSKWLLVESCVSLSSDLETPTFYQSLAGVTHLEETDICDLEKVFWHLKSSAPTGQLDIESLGPLLCPPLPRTALHGLFAAFDENLDGHIDFKELCCGVSCSCRGPDVERTKFCFKIFDTDRDGILNSSEVEQMIRIMLLVAKECCTTNAYRNITYEQTSKDLHNFVIKHGDSSASADSFSLSQEDFLMWCVQSNINISQPFLDLLFEMCHIVFGLRPQCKHLEFKIVKGWLSREVRRGYEVGQFWYLISSDWWQNWLFYTQSNNQTSPCSYCKLMNHRAIIDNVEEIICDDSCFSSNLTESTGNFTENGDSSSLGSGSSGISISRHSSIPGPIDNSTLLAVNPFKTIQALTGEGGRLKREIPLVAHRDYELVPEALWKALSQWYGGNLALPRQVVKPPHTEEKELELYPLNLRILRHQQTQTNQMSITPQASSWNSISGGYGTLSSAGYSSVAPAMSTLTVAPKKYTAYIAAFSRLATVKQVAEFLCQRIKLKQDTIRLWHMGQNGDAPYLLEDEPCTLEELGFVDNDQILLEIRNKDLTWPEELRAISQNHTVTAQERDRRGTVASVQSVYTPGATGLHNLGNTCFMNSALQVLFNTKPLTEYFRQNIHLFELNTNNKMGTKGYLAIKYAELLKEILSAQTRSIAPLKFRFCVSKFAPQFAGGGQHDSQELLDWLLDTLHEDLNRVTEKPYIELKDSNGRSDQAVAAESWEATLQRNKSIIVDLFYGQLKSKVACETCGTESVRFDPFSLLSLPLPVENYTYCEVLVTKLDGSCPIKYGARLNSECKYWDLKNHLAPMCNLEPKSILLCQLEGSQIKYILSNEQKINANSSQALYAYELPKSTEIDRSRAGSELGNIEKGLKDIQRNQEQNQLTTSSSSSAEDSALNAKEKTQSDNETQKVSRCFGNSCMPSNLLCFKHSIELLGTSPMSTFLDATAGTYSMKTISTTNLLSTSSVDLPEKTTQPLPAKQNGCSTCNNHPDFDDDDISISSSRDTRRCVNYDGQCDYLIAVHRKFTRQDTYFLSHHKTKPSLFGVPLLIPLHEGVQNKDLYCSVWLQVSRLLSPLPPTSRDQSNHAEDCDDSLGYDFPFALRAVKENGQVCALCPWAKFCRGCQIPCNDELLLHGIISTSCCSSNSSTPNMSVRDMSTVNPSITSIYIAIDWDTSALHLRYQSTREKIFKEHSSVATIRRQQIEPVDLDHCLRAFTSEEKLEQTYYCSHCKSKQPATKKLQIWKLPPMLIVHLKRFNYVSNKWVKSQKVVNFPFDNFDPTPYLASVPQETILRHKELLELKSKNIRNHDCDDEITEFDLENDIDAADKSESENNRVCDIIQENVEMDETDSTKSPTRSHLNLSKPSRRKRLVSTSLTKTPIVDGQFTDYNNHQLKPNADPFDLKYKLYAVVSHSGMLNGGHYIAYASSANNKSWYCFNDSSCREIPHQPSIDPSSAYLLFYERQNLDYLPYLPKIENKSPILNGHVEMLEENDNDIKKMCVIS